MDNVQRMSDEQLKAIRKQVTDELTARANRSIWQTREKREEVCADPRFKEVRRKLGDLYRGV